ncbi:hypothetical protein HYC85_008423 [Camellia sinensis]|uniref:Uncharacterized protein n=1 Tax=Camellia sinensis TaxID=4442 RepID=A0A7J7HT51_CAMSI|nr:hypothetical protein HYC85_008423 [Camellia sinensis]
MKHKILIHPCVRYLTFRIFFLNLLGFFGEVFRGIWNGTDVAIKVFLEQDLTVQNIEDFYNEISILRMTIKEVGLPDAALDALVDMNHHQTSHTGEIYEVLSKGENSVEGPVNSFLDKDLEAALDSFDNLFCRRCLVEKQLPWSFPDEGNIPCATERIEGHVKQHGERFKMTVKDGWGLGVLVHFLLIFCVKILWIFISLLFSFFPLI